MAKDKDKYTMSRRHVCIVSVGAYVHRLHDPRRYLLAAMYFYVEHYSLRAGLRSVTLQGTGYRSPVPEIALQWSTCYPSTSVIIGNSEYGLRDQELTCGLCTS